MLTVIATVLMIFTTVVVGQQQQCKATYSCTSTLTQEDCATNDGFLVLGEHDDCCPTCGTGLPYNATTCDTETVCAPGLKCLENRCILNKGTRNIIISYFDHIMTHYEIFLKICVRIHITCRTLKNYRRVKSTAHLRQNSVKVTGYTAGEYACYLISFVTLNVKPA